MSDMDTSRPVSGTLARIGLGARAIVYFAVCFLLLRAAFTSEADDGATPGEAFRMIEATTGGRILLVALAGGLFLYALWRYQQAALDTDDQGNDAKGLLARLGMFSSGTSYALVGFAAGAVAFDADDGGGGGKTEETAKWLMEQPFGPWFVGLSGLALIGIGIAQVWRTQSDQWKKSLDLSGWPQRAKPVIEFGIAGRGVLFGLIGLFLIVGAYNADSSDVKGLAGTLGWIRTQPFGLTLFIVASVAIGAYGIYSGVQSMRHRFPGD
ncbi:DUF1206 domain-containing protein [Henriciella barbarensis]|uniref:DUF1206 domain-containing protein n=1 Tax=Henriciella barbarensis TaxID=86342 RepID=A0A399R4C8_9PROT|nr:DUF1206 domain-containing protein [Henriciella barbarensis]RIJ25793.1 DUF1206 domain-containing protein [Henriciella barbarensis]